jgi:hypothetical protein
VESHREQSHPRIEIKWITTGMAIGEGMPKPWELTSHHHMLWIPDRELQDLVFDL